MSTDTKKLLQRDACRRTSASCSAPGPSPVSPRVMRAMVAPVLSHLDPDMLALLDDVRARLTSVFQAPEDALSLAISGTGTAGMEAAVANHGA